tara:strand:+ start:453 stop:683 length:231 start_codon:yes stop_codon:yes gene_type:complete
MKILKFIPLLFVLTFYNSTAVVAQECEEIKGNIVAKLFCKGKNKYGDGDSSGDVSSSGEKSGWSFWKKPEWMKNKN